MRIFETVLMGAVLSVGIVSGADLKAGQAAYEAACKSCHGLDGTPKKSLAKHLKITMKDLRDPSVLKKTDAELKKNILSGTGKMDPVPAADLPRAAIDDCIAYMRTLKK